MLIHQNSNATALAQELNRFPKTFAPFENFEAEPAARFANMSIDVRITDPLVDGCGWLAARKMRQSRAKFPGTDVAEAENERLLLSETIFDMLEMFQTNTVENFFHRHAGELHATKEIGAELLKMSPHYPAQLFSRELVAESDPDITQRQLSVVRQDKPRDSATDLPEGK